MNTYTVRSLYIDKETHIFFIPLYEVLITGKTLLRKTNMVSCKHSAQDGVTTCLSECFALNKFRLGFPVSRSHDDISNCWCCSIKKTENTFSSWLFFFFFSQWKKSNYRNFFISPFILFLVYAFSKFRMLPSSSILGIILAYAEVDHTECNVVAGLSVVWLKGASRAHSCAVIT